MNMRFLSVLSLFAALSLSSCGDANKRTDGTAGTAVTDMDSAAADGGVKADAVVIDNNAGPTVTANPDSLATAPDSTK